MYNSVATPTACAVLHLLHVIPETWEVFNRESLTAAEDEAVGHMMASGLLELRWTARITMAGHPAEFTVKAQRTGFPSEDSLFVHLYAEWGSSIEQWKAANPGVAAPVHFEASSKQEWRLTGEGIIAREDVRSEDREKWETVADWALHRRFFKDKPYPEGRFQIVSMKVEGGKKSLGPASVPVTNVGNWSEGAAQFKAEFANLFTQAVAATPRIRIGPMTALTFGVIYDGGGSTEKTYTSRFQDWVDKERAYSDGKGALYVYVDALSEGMKIRARDLGHL